MRTEPQTRQQALDAWASSRRADLIRQGKSSYEAVEQQAREHALIVSAEQK